MQGVSHASHESSSGSLPAGPLSHFHTQYWDCRPEAWLLPLPIQLGNGDRKLIPVAHAAASQENEGKLAVSDYSWCQTVHPSDDVIILLFMPRPPRTILSFSPMTTLLRLGTHHHIAQSQPCPSVGIPGLFNHSLSG